MTSKSSFWVNLKLNAKRRTWNLAVFAIGFFFMLPVTLMVGLSSVKSRYIPEDEYFVEAIENAFRGVMVLNPFTVFIITIFAMIAAIHGFSYLYSKKKVDMYLSVPVKIEARFLAIFVNSIIMFVVPYLIFLLISVVIAGTYGFTNTYIIKLAFITFGMNTIYYIAVYAVTTIAVMLTGTLPVTVLGACTLLAYENAVKFIVMIMCGSYFSTYNSLTNKIFLNTWLSPIGIFAKYYTEVSEAVYYEQSIMPAVFKTGIHIIILCIVFMAVAFWLYKIRPSESSQKSMAFKKTKTTIKRLIMIPSVIILGVAFDEAVGRSIPMAVFGIIIGILLTHAVIQAIYELDLRAVLKDKRSIIYVGVITAAVFSIFRFDILGYDKYIPNQSKLSGGAVSFNMPFIQNGDYYSDNFRYLSFNEYSLNNVEIDDTSLMYDLAVAAADCQTEMEKMEDTNNYYEYQEEYRFISGVIKYTMANGKNVYRDIRINAERNAELLDRVFNNEGFKQNYTMLYNDVLNDYDNIIVLFSNHINDCYVENVKDFIEAYKKDFGEINYSKFKDINPAGYLRFTVDVYSGELGRKRTLSFDFPMFNEFKNANAVLKAEGIEINHKLSPDDVDVIKVYPYERDEENNTIEITDKNELKQILDNAVLRESDRFGLIYRSSSGYDICVQLNSGEEEWYNFIEGAVPDFIK